MVLNMKIPKLNEMKKYKVKQLKELCSFIRQEIINLSKEKVIHLSSNLGIVELSTTLLYVFDSPNDQIMYDTGHQTYVHKILTGRYNLFKTIRDFNGLSGFQEPKESIHDFISTGHSGNMISIAQGINENKNNKNYFIPVVGDASISNGLSLEALNDVSYNKTKMIIIINDNEMSISKNVGAIHNLMSKFKMSKFNFIGGNIVRKIMSKNNFLKKIYLFFSTISYKMFSLFIKNNFFESMDYKYIGLVDGHNIKKLIYAFEKAKWYSDIKPVIVHVKTKKGYGISNAISDFNGEYHSTTLEKNKFSNEIYYCDVAVNHIEKLLKENINIKILNPAMTYSTGFLNLSKKYKDNYEDVGIAEEHCVAKAVGIAKLNTKKVIVPIYSTFLQRTYDQLHHDVARNRLPITFLVDRADIAYGDGDTHHGIYDLAFLKSIPNTIVTSPSNKFELEKLIDMSLKNDKDPFFIRYGKDICLDVNVISEFNFGEWIHVQNKNSNSLIISYGNIINELSKRYKNKKIDIINAIFLTKYDINFVLKILKKYMNIYVIEKTYYVSNLYSDLLKISFENKIKVNIKSISIKTNEIGFGSKEIIDKKLNIDFDSIDRLIK